MPSSTLWLILGFLLSFFVVNCFYFDPTLFPITWLKLLFYHAVEEAWRSGQIPEKEKKTTLCVKNANDLISRYVM